MLVKYFVNLKGISQRSGRVTHKEHFVNTSFGKLICSPFLQGEGGNLFQTYNFTVDIGNALYITSVPT